jgi:hypothetical protein
MRSPFVYDHKPLRFIAIRDQNAADAPLLRFTGTSRNKQSAIWQTHYPERSVSHVLSKEAERLVCFQQHSGVSVTPKPPTAVGEGRRLNAHQGVAAVDDVLSHKSEIGVVLVRIVLLDSFGQSANDEESPATSGDPAGAVKHLPSLMPPQKRKIVSAVYVDPRVGVALRIIELAQVDGHVDLAINVAEIAMVVGD